MRRLVIVTGLSGAGKSQAMKSFEDIGFYCLDNVPPAILANVVDLAGEANVGDIAISPDARAGGVLGDPVGAIETIATTRGIAPELLFLDAADDVLIRRYSETRRRHPLASDRPLGDAIAAERALLEPLRERASAVWDTSELTNWTLKDRIRDRFGGTDAGRLTVVLLAFGFKYGLPLDADLVFDVRFLPNPNYVPALRPLTGADAPVAEYLERLPQTGEFLARLRPLLDFVLPQYAGEGKSQLTIAIGCTGGRHRSVYMARTIAGWYRSDARFGVRLELRDAAR